MEDKITKYWFVETEDISFLQFAFNEGKISHSWLVEQRKYLLFIRWVHTSVVSRPQVHLNATSDVNGFNFSSSSLLCAHGDAFPSKEPKYTLKYSSDHPYELAYAPSKHNSETEVNHTNQRRGTAGNSKHANTWSLKICFYFAVRKQLKINPFRMMTTFEKKTFFKSSCCVFVLLKCSSGHRHN